MTSVQALILGVVQGLTEFLPISSDGHLALMHHALGFAHADLVFDVFLHGATLLAVILFFWKDIWKMSLKEAAVIVISTIPAVAFGAIIKDRLEMLSASLVIIGVFEIVTGLMNLQAARCMAKPGEKSQAVTFKQGLIIGIFQALAILPGWSRSSGTVAAAVTQDIDREKAFRFSFLLGIPAIAGAATLTLVDVWKAGFPGIQPFPYLVGGFAAFCVGLGALKLLQWVISHAKFQWFGWYCLALGSVTIVAPLVVATLR